MTRRLFPLVALLALALLAHLLALQAGWIWDDNDYITANPLLRAHDGWWTAWIPGATPQYYPLVFTSFWVEYAIAADTPTLYHATNMVLHALSTALLWRVLVRLDIPHALWIAALFAVHPMGVETVAWATERKNTLSLLFALASVWSFLSAQRATRERVLGFHIAAFMLFVCALLSKTTAVFVAPVLVLIALHERRRLDGRFALLLLPYFVIGAALGLFTALVEKTHVGATGAEFELSLLARVLLASRNLVFYIAHFALPTEQIFVYPRLTIMPSSIMDWVPLALMLVLATACVREWKHSRAPMLILLWLCAALFPALGFFDVWPFRFSFVADHFAYAAMPALATGFVLLLSRLLPARAQETRVFSMILVAAIATCIALSWRATEKYASVETLWRDTVLRNDQAWLAHNNLASELLEQAGEASGAGERDRVHSLATEALHHATMAYDLKPDELTHASNQSEALRLLGRNEEALTAIDAAIATAPHFTEFRWMRGRLLEQLGRRDDARLAYESAACEGCDSALDARRSLVALAVARKDYTDALKQQQQVVLLSPQDADAIANLGALLQATGDAEGGRRELLRAITSGKYFSDERVFRATAARYLGLAIEASLGPSEMEMARDLARQLAQSVRDDASFRYFALALELRDGLATARGELETLEKHARAANATTLADAIAAFLRTH